MKFLEVLKSRNGKILDIDLLEPLVENVCQRFKIQLLYLFGSYATKNISKLSDLDIAFFASDDIKLEKWGQFLGELQDIFEEEAIDLVDLKNAPLPLIHRILRDGKCLYAINLESRINFETRSETFYQDTKYLRMEYFDALLRRIENGTFGCR
ncbi:MAG: nucleotidyltransferase domain-containing protein [Candidatus Firestonebacteria bacterium]